MTEDLFSPLALRGTEIPNRVMVSPMCQYSCEERDGLATDWHRTHLGARAVGGAGVVMTEATAIEPRGRISPEDLGIWSAEHAEALAPITEFIRSQGSVPATQLAHAGRKASTRRPWEGGGPLQPDEGGWDAVAPSAIPYPGHESPVDVTALSSAEVTEMVDTFAQAAEYALDAGFEIAELHAAHGYLLHEFLSPVANGRDDEYGGSFENRIRFLLEVTDAVRAVWPNEYPLFVRISGTDWLPDRESWTVEQSARLADRLAAAGVDLVDVSSGGIHPDQQLPPSGPNYQVPLAEHVREHTSEAIGIGAVGGITTAEQADALIRNDRADLAIVGREFLRDPQFPLRAARELDALDRVDVPPQYERAF
ncbi:NADH:flavin oxidoreductase/NADH oxidase [Natranaeroarchaeum aerophilus]|uniref:NADH:flavin oxidoreductase/NADH oxidase n=1 Tax=Natranaeroarchaeum aerophilus TaxID=2917711 RepID=A0AAE3FNA0_9EURY|nr:NADH:flavin oxidoreductase/NADH oxidase [Natranaeroarchaeum aerophilus]MCL9812274.1 NADH:flavin oxidoreductase/NADH oxidase [Natranaeroarchaeum aerophilus]